MKNNYTPEKILIIISLVLFSGIIFYNAFFIPDVSTPTVIYVDKDNFNTSETQSETNSRTINNSLTDSNNTNSTESSSKSTSNSGKININTATEAELAENIPGVGESIAKRIVEYRTYNGNFLSIEEIKNVSGIGDKKFEAMKDIICV